MNRKSVANLMLTKKILPPLQKGQYCVKATVVNYLNVIKISSFVVKIKVPWNDGVCMSKINYESGYRHYFYNLLDYVFLGGIAGAPRAGTGGSADPVAGARAGIGGIAPVGFVPICLAGMGGRFAG